MLGPIGGYAKTYYNDQHCTLHTSIENSLALSKHDKIKKHTFYMSKTSAPFYMMFFLLCLSTSCEQAEQDAPPPPNILFAIADDASFPHMSAYGTPWVHTPGFDRVAREGLLFMNAYTPNAKCAPSRAVILTGRNSWQLEEACNHQPFFPAKFKTFAEALPEAGYKVGYTAKGWAPGIAEINGVKRDLIGTSYNEHKTTPPAKFMSNNDYAENFKAFLDTRKKDEPFFFWYGSTEPHRAYEFEAGINYGGKKLADIDKVPPFWPDTDSIRADMLDYAFEIEYFDSHLDKMLKELDERGLLENTIVVVTADNGMPFPRIKGQMYELNNHLPLAIRWPKGIETPGREVDQFVSFTDFAPTFLQAAAIDEDHSGLQDITGESLMDIFANRSENSEYRNHTLIGKERHDVGRPHDQGYPVRGIIKDGYLFVENFEPERWPVGNPETGYLNTDGSPTKTYILDHQKEPGMEKYWQMNFGHRPSFELYEIDRDPYCTENLATDPALRSKMQSLKDQMYEELKRQGDPRILGHGEIFDQYKVAGGTAGFYERFMSGEEIQTGWVNKSDYETILPLDND